MTRFSRAKGSKASNERVREEATPWHIMKEQFEESLNKGKCVEEKSKTARQLLKEKEELNLVKTDWAEFEVSKSNKKVGESQDSNKIEKAAGKKLKKKKSIEKQVQNDTDHMQDVSEEIGTFSKRKQVADSKENLKELKKKKKKRSALESDISVDSAPAPKKKKIEATDANKAKKDKALKNKKKVVLEKFEETSPIGEESKAKPKEKLSKRQKRNLKKKSQSSLDQNSKFNKARFDHEENDRNVNVNLDNKNNKFEKNSPAYNPRMNGSDRGFQNQNNFFQDRFRRFEGQRPHMKQHHLRQPKIRDDKEHDRRKPIKSMKLMINGMEIEVVLYDGFPVQKEDAQRLKELKQQMILKGIPKSEIDAAMKLERRKAEKALARIRKQVCFHCRKAGHNLSDCPELGKEESATGICFKCGSTEHTHFECKVTKSDDYRYATCFICREQGHIAKQCPDNPKGLYPKGGACNLCGDVTHLKKDCPDAARKKEETSITVKTITNSALESLEEDEKQVRSKKLPKKNVVKF